VSDDDVLYGYRLRLFALAGEIGVRAACRAMGVHHSTYYRWKARQENPLSNEQLRATELEAEVARFKTLVAELALDRRMLQEAWKKKS